MQETGAPIPYDPNDPDDGPYDPNDDAAVDAYWDEGIRLGLVTVGVGSNARVVKHPQPADPVKSRD